MIITQRFNDLIIDFYPIPGMDSDQGTVHRCGLCGALVGDRATQSHTAWHDGLRDHAAEQSGETES